MVLVLAATFVFEVRHTGNDGMASSKSSFTISDIETGEHSDPTLEWLLIVGNLSYRTLSSFVGNANFSTVPSFSGGKRHDDNDEMADSKSSLLLSDIDKGEHLVPPIDWLPNGRE
mmetsp:Transcript_14525/g.14720  ORF Transcript_14525/g.14720 Transcript_14525/m.14720 type:complete len:115 (-) Transcript_14525:330-674(-)